MGLRGGYSNMSDVRDARDAARLRLDAQPDRHRRRGPVSGKAIGDERRRQVTKRQNEAKAAMRRYVDDVTFQVAKDSRDRLRTVQRDLRDHFTEQAEQLKRSLAESQQAAERALKATRAERDARLAEIGKELDALELVRRQAPALLASRGRPRPSRRRPGRQARRDRPRGRGPPRAPARDRRPPRPAGDRAVAAPAAVPARRAAAGGDRGEGQGGQVDAAQRAGGEQVAPTDAGECTRVVTWYRDGTTPRIVLHPARGRAAGRCPCADTTAR